MRIVIIGNGVAGVTCAFEARKRDPDATITLISGETDYFFSRTALMYAYMDTMTRRNLEPFERGVYDKQRIARHRAWVVDHDADARVVVTDTGERIPYDRLVLAVGASPNRFPWAGLDDAKDGVVHFVSMQDLDACERLTPSTRHAVVVGGGLIGIELVECLRHHGVGVTFLVREDWYWPMALAKEEAEIVAEQLRAHVVDLRLREEMTRVEVDASGRVAAVHTSTGDRIACEMLGIAAGVRPNVDRLSAWRDAPALDGGIVVDATLETSIPGVFACGDCAVIDRGAHERPLHETIWYSAKRQGALVAANLFGDARRYAPPVFFNSSKFFEVEYTTVGEVVRLPEGASSILLRLPRTEISARVVYHEGRVIGFNMLGSRWDHEVLERWILERRDPEWVVRSLGQAQFDVEFGRATLARFQRHDLVMETSA